MNPAIAKKLAAVERSPTVDTLGLCEIVEELEGYKPSQETVRRWPIKYKLVGRIRRYEVDHVIAFVRHRYEQAPVRVAAAAVSRRRTPPGGPTRQNSKAEDRLPPTS
jgi:hypothetical protein